MNSHKPVIEYSFLQHFFISSKETYEDILCECLNKSLRFKAICGGQFEIVKEQSHGECDVRVFLTGYELDFKLMISETLAEFQSLSSPRVVEIAKGVTAFGKGKKIKQKVVLLPNACRNMTKEQLEKHREDKDKLSKAVVYFFDKILNTPKNILLFLPLYVTTTNKSLSFDEQIAAIKNEFSDTLQYIYSYRLEKYPSLETFFVYIVNNEKMVKFYFVISQFTSKGLDNLDLVDMFSLKSTVELDIYNRMF